MDKCQLSTPQPNAYTLGNMHNATNNSNDTKKTPQSKTAYNIFKCPNNSPEFKKLDARDINETSEYSDNSVDSQPLAVDAFKD